MFTHHILAKHFGQGVLQGRMRFALDLVVNPDGLLHPGRLSHPLILGALQSVDRALIRRVGQAFKANPAAHDDIDLAGVAKVNPAAINPSAASERILAMIRLPVCPRLLRYLLFSTLPHNSILQERRGPRENTWCRATVPVPLR